MTVRGIVSLALMLAGAACSGDTETPTSATTTTTGPTIILFSGTLQPRATRFYSYTLATAGSVTALLASVERNGIPSTNALELAIGTPVGTGCAATVSANSPAALVPQLRHDATAGTYCVRVADSDGLSAAVTFTIRVVLP